MNNPTPHSHTHCQVDQADTQAKTWQKVCLSQRTTDQQMDEEKKCQTVGKHLKKHYYEILTDNIDNHIHNIFSELPGCSN